MCVKFNFTMLLSGCDQSSKTDQINHIYLILLLLLVVLQPVSLYYFLCSFISNNKSNSRLVVAFFIRLASLLWRQKQFYPAMKTGAWMTSVAISLVS